MTRRTAAMWVLLAASATGASYVGLSRAGWAAAESLEAEPFKRMTIDDLAARPKEAQAGKRRLYAFDNNSQERYARSHIPTARWVKYDAIQPSDLPADREAALVLYCASEH